MWVPDWLFTHTEPADIAMRIFTYHDVVSSDRVQEIDKVLIVQL